MVTKLIQRKLTHALLHHLRRGKSILLLGPRQVGKTTLLSNISNDLSINFIEHRVRLQYEKNPDLFYGEIEGLQKKCPLVIIDEVQRVPQIMDAVQDLIDKGKAQFILTGSSARKLKRHIDINLLPGRVVGLRLDPLMYTELVNHADLIQLLTYGSLPGVYFVGNESDKEADLISYVETYLEEEVRREALVRNLGPFTRFLELAALESGNIINYSSLASELGVDKNTVANYFEILFDCLIAEKVDPITNSRTRKRLTKASRFLFFDLGVQRVAAGQNQKLDKIQLGHAFEEWVGLEIIRQMRVQKSRSRLRFWRDPSGPEVDWVIEVSGKYIPIEVKWTSSPKPQDIRHIQVFRTEYSNSTDGYLVCRCQRKVKMADKIWAIPFQNLSQILG